MQKRDVGVAMLILALLVMLGAAGEYNYRRNKAVEESAAPRRYIGYSDEELAALIEAYEQEVEKLASRHDAAKSRRVETRDGGLIDEQIREFERAQATGVKERSLGADAAQQEAILRELRKERSLRTGRGHSFMLHLRRLLSI
jgi:hypothetical protein